MSKSIINFFEKKREWSITKDKILGRYLRPYFQKLIAFNKPICYVDCFSGKGIFDDGQLGSPLIALQCIFESINHARRELVPINTYFIELNYYVELEKNVSAFFENNSCNCVTYKVLPGKFEDNIDKLLENHFGDTIFLYIDPYGIKAIDVEKFNSFKTSYNKSVELLINFNTWGFFREACRVLKKDFKMNASMKEYLIEYDPDNKLNRDELSKIAGSDFWIEIVQNYKNNIISSTEAESLLARGIEANFKKKYKYVLNVPVMSSDNAVIPKYRLFYLTNHEQGYIIMSETMFKGIQEALVENRNGQLSLFEIDNKGDLCFNEKITTAILNELTFDDERIDPFLCRIISKYGLIAPPSKIREVIRQLEINNCLVVERFPKYTYTGKLSVAITEKNSKIYVKRK